MSTTWAGGWQARGQFQSGKETSSQHYRALGKLKKVTPPNPPKNRDVFTLLKAFDLTTWIFILASLLVFPLVLTAVSRAEDSVAGDGLLYWRRADNSAWFTFGSFLGETMGGEADGRFTAARCARVRA